VSRAPLEVGPSAIRRLAIVRQRLAGPPADATGDGLRDVVRALRCLQLDPTNVVARSHLLVLYSRLGAFDPGLVDELVWKDKFLFHYFAHAASLVLVEDYQLHRRRMRRWATGDDAWSRRVRQWMRQNAALRRHVLTELRARGPLRSRDLEDRARTEWESTGWTRGRNVSRMLEFLWARGDITVAGRVGGQRLWDVAERWMPQWTPRHGLNERQAVRRAAELSLRCLGVATAAHISRHFTRGQYPGLGGVLARLEGSGDAVRVVPRDEDGPWPGDWYVHAADAPLLEGLGRDDWQPRTTLLSPFDNLICDRSRTERVFGFSYRIEIYVPATKRRYGYFSMPVLVGERLVARVDPRLDRERTTLVIRSIHPEPDAPLDRATGAAVAGAIEELAHFVGATDIELEATPPKGWAGQLAL
jgi:uncharacterized protein